MDNQKLPISVFIIAVNEADRIANAIKSVINWVDEVIVIDSGSKDNTVELSESLGAKVYFNAWPGYGEQKRFGEDKCKNKWIINIDADEFIPANLVAEIKDLFKNSQPAHQGYFVKISEILPGEAKPSKFCHYINCIRLYNIDCGRFSDSTVHDTVRMKKGTTGQLKQVVLHRSSRSIFHSIDKLNKYSSMQAENMKQKPKKFLLLRLCVEFPYSFIKAYILRLYIFKGMQGFVYSMLYAFGRFVRIAKYYENKAIDKLNLSEKE